MIAVIEGPSAAGKTSWVRRHHEQSAVWEYQPTGAEPSYSDGAHRAAQFWAAANAERWMEAVELEARRGLAVCDTDPLKLHYVWTLWRIGEVAYENWRAEADEVRRTFAEGRLGVADLIVVELPSEAALRERKQADATRRRRNFDLHVRLVEPLREWYSAVDALDPGRVRWSLPDGPLSANAAPPRQQRTGSGLFDALLGELPAR